MNHKMERRGIALVITIASESLSGSSSSGNSSPASALLTAVNSVNDAALGASIGSALGLPTLNVTSVSSPQQTNLTKTVKVVCAPGHW